MSEQDQALARVEGGWRYSVDPAYAADGQVPAHAVVGAWPLGPDGAAGAFVPNPGYQPPAPDGTAAGAAPTDPVEDAIRRAATGQGSEAAVLDVLAGATLYLPADADGRASAYQDEDGSFVVVLTDPNRAPADAPALVPLSAQEVVDLLPEETALWINPESDVSVGISSTQLRDALHSSSPDPARPVAPAPFTEPAAPAEPAPSGFPRKGSNV